MKKCLECKKEFIAIPSNIKRGGGKYCSMRCYHAQAVAHKKGIESPFWKGEKATLTSIHDALKTERGKATKCENPNCLGKSKRYDWALIKGRRYEDRNHNDYWQLCRKCHKAYDFVEKKHKRNTKGTFI